MVIRDIVPVSKDYFIVNGCKVKVTYSEEGDADNMKIIQKLIHEALRPECKKVS